MPQGREGKTARMVMELGGSPDQFWQRRGDPSCEAWVGAPSSCRRRAGGARQVFEGELAVAAAEEREEPEQMEQESDHRARIFSGSEPTDQLLGCGRSFGEGQALR